MKKTILSTVILTAITSTAGAASTASSLINYSYANMPAKTSQHTVEEVPFETEYYGTRAEPLTTSAEKTVHFETEGQHNQPLTTGKEHVPDAVNASAQKTPSLTPETKYQRYVDAVHTFQAHPTESNKFALELASVAYHGLTPVAQQTPVAPVEPVASNQKVPVPMNVPEMRPQAVPQATPALPRVPVQTQKVPTLTPETKYQRYVDAVHTFEAHPTESNKFALELASVAYHGLTPVEQKTPVAPVASNQKVPVPMNVPEMRPQAVPQATPVLSRVPVQTQKVPTLTPETKYQRYVDAVHTFEAHPTESNKFALELASVAYHGLTPVEQKTPVAPVAANQKVPVPMNVPEMHPQAVPQATPALPRVPVQTQKVPTLTPETKYQRYVDAVHTFEAHPTESNKFALELASVAYHGLTPVAQKTPDAPVATQKTPVAMNVPTLSPQKAPALAPTIQNVPVAHQQLTPPTPAAQIRTPDPVPAENLMHVARFSMLDVHNPDTLEHAKALAHNPLYAGHPVADRAQAIVNADLAAHTTAVAHEDAQGNTVGHMTAAAVAAPASPAPAATTPAAIPNAVSTVVMRVNDEIKRATSAEQKNADAAAAAQTTANDAVSKTDFQTAQDAQNSAINAVGVEAKDNTSAITKLQSDKADLSVVTALSTKVDTKADQSDVDAIQKTVASNTSTITTTSKTVQSNSSKIAGNVTNITNNTTNITNNRTDITALENSQKQQDVRLSKDETTENTHFLSLSKDVKQAQDTGAYAQSRADAAFANAAANRQALADSNQRIADNSKQLANHEQRIQDLESNNQTNFNKLEKQQNEDRKEFRAGLAGAYALSSIPQAPSDHTVGFGMGAGTFHSQNAIAAGVSARVSNNVSVKTGMSWDTQGNVGAGAGFLVSY